MPVTEPNVPSFLITNLELVEEKPEFRFCWQAPTTIGRICREAVVIRNNGPEASYLHRHRPIEGADLDSGGKCQPRQFKGFGRMRTITVPLSITHDFGIGTFPSAAAQNS
jgi:hypothetical protein